MLNRLKSLMGGLAAGASTPAPEEHVRLAAAALLVEAASMDGGMGEAERAKIEELLATRFTLSAAEARQLLDEAADANERATQLLPFTRSIKDAFGYDERVEMIRMLWEVAYADAQLHDYEANLVRRISGLIYVSDQDAGTARKHALARLGLTD